VLAKSVVARKFWLKFEYGSTWVDSQLCVFVRINGHDQSPRQITSECAAIEISLKGSSQRNSSQESNLIMSCGKVTPRDTALLTHTCFQMQGRMFLSEIYTGAQSGTNIVDKCGIVLRGIKKLIIRNVVAINDTLLRLQLGF
jgi:hypothetical protein